MTVGELIEALRELPLEAPVILTRTSDTAELSHVVHALQDGVVLLVGKA